MPVDSTPTIMQDNTLAKLPSVPLMPLRNWSLMAAWLSKAAVLAVAFLSENMLNMRLLSTGGRV